jgi:hypothetical protein
MDNTLEAEQTNKDNLLEAEQKRVNLLKACRTGGKRWQTMSRRKLPVEEV